MKKNLFLRLCLMMIVLLSLPSCRQDILQEQEAYHNTNAFHLKSSRISLDEAKHKAKLLPEIDQVEHKFKTYTKSNAQGKLVNYANGVSIDTESVIYIENGPNFHTYTFTIKRNNSPETAPLENLLLVPETDGSYKEFLVTYNLTPQEREEVRNGEPVDTSGKTTITELAKGSFNSSGQLAKMTCDWQQEIVWQNCSGKKKDGEPWHDQSNVSDWGNCSADVKPNVYIVITGGCNIEQPETIDYPGGPGSGTGSGGGGDGTDPGTLPECTTVANNPGEVGITNPSGCNTGFPTQLNDVRPNQKTPCQSIKTSTADSKYKTHATTLKGKGDQNYEEGYKLSYPVPNSGQSGTQDQVIQNYPGTRQLDFTATNYNFAFLHSHHNGLYPIFSPDDLAALNIWIKGVIDYNSNPNNLPKINIKELTISVVTYRGTYLISFDGTTIDSYPVYTKEQWLKLYNRYTQLMIEAGNDSNPEYMEKIETQFLKFTQKYMPMPGMKLFKVEDTGNTEIYIENGTRKTKECPK